MPEYVLTSGAEDDLDKIVAYTTTRWGAGQAQRYGSELNRHFQSLVDDRARTKLVFEGWPELQMSRCEHHYVFSIRQTAAPMAILAVLHEHMDLPTRLRARLNEDRR